ncbi:MAG TPA: hypothetical protein VM599_09745 [Thermoanaerobaculia bacterium]|nr:hypothetical protein [Thermoanaerobaculia bacterium]
MPERTQRSEARKTLLFALDKYPERIQAIDLDQLVLESARQNEKRPAYVKVAVPDEWVKSLRGPREGQNRLLLVEVPREVEERSESAIILPGEL